MEENGPCRENDLKKKNAKGRNTRHGGFSGKAAVGTDNEVRVTRNMLIGNMPH